MAGHSRWANIRHRKNRADAKRGKLFSRLVKEVAVAAKVGGGDVDANPRLRLALEKAREANVPSGNIERAIARGAGKLAGADYEEARYEGYAPGGAAVIIDCLTDNLKRTVAEVRHAFSRHGGRLGANGSVAYLFKHCGVMLFAAQADEKENEKMMEAAINAGAEDFLPVETDDGGAFEMITAPGDFLSASSAMKENGFSPTLAEVMMRPENIISLSEADGARARKLLDMLEDLDDTQQIYCNAEFPPDDEE